MKFSTNSFTAAAQPPMLAAAPRASWRVALGRRLCPLSWHLVLQLGVGAVVFTLLAFAPILSCFVPFGSMVWFAVHGTIAAAWFAYALAREARKP